MDGVVLELAALSQQVQLVNGSGGVLQDGGTQTFGYFTDDRQTYAYGVLKNPTDVRFLERGRIGFWDADLQTSRDLQPE